VFGTSPLTAAHASCGCKTPRPASGPTTPLPRPRPPPRPWRGAGPPASSGTSPVTVLYIIPKTLTRTTGREIGRVMHRRRRRQASGTEGGLGPVLGAVCRAVCDRRRVVGTGREGRTRGVVTGPACWSRAPSVPRGADTSSVSEFGLGTTREGQCPKVDRATALPCSARRPPIAIGTSTHGGQHV